MATPRPKIKRQKIKLNAKKSGKITAALKTWVHAADKNNSDPFDLDKAPQWAENALVEAVKVTLPGNRLPTAGEWDMQSQHHPGQTRGVFGARPIH
jgi:hypothetical protein